MKRDVIMEVICVALGLDYYQDTHIQNITVCPPTNDSQLLIVTDSNNQSFSIEIKSIKE